jgi:hypothetical protein
VKSSIQTSEVGYTFSIQTNFLWHNCRAIIKQAYSENFQDLIFLENFTSFCDPAQRENLNFSPKTVTILLSQLIYHHKVTT